MPILVLAAGAAVAMASQAAQLVHVSPTASANTGDGSAAKPFTLTAAVRHLRGRAAGTTVQLAGGDYFLDAALILTSADGGEQGNPVTYRSAFGERARLLGGIELPWSTFRPAAPSPFRQDGLMVADLASQGITNTTLLGARGVDNLKAELFEEQDGRFVPQQYAQDPNPSPDGFWNWAGLQSIIGGSGRWFLFNDTEMVQSNGWIEAVNTSGFSLFGHWGDEEGVESAAVQSISPVHGATGRVLYYNITLEQAYWMSHARGGFRVTHDERFVAADALEFVDLPGEYWIDREALHLYWLPPAGRPVGRLFLSISPSLASSAASWKHPQALVQIQGTPWVSWVNITVALATQSLFSASSITGLHIEGGKFLGAGASCVSISGNFSNVSTSDISYCGATGLSLSGGNWNQYGPNLFISAEMLVQGNRISNWARWQRTPNSAGLSWDGVGHHVRGNIFTDAPEPAAMSNGNVDCLFENNLISNVNYEQTDMGAYYHGSASGGYQLGWTQPGNIIRNNTWARIRFYQQSATQAQSKFTTQAIYMDDEQSGYTIVENTFIDVDVGIFIGGGRAHVVTNNTFKSCGTACLHIGTHYLTISSAHETSPDLLNRKYVQIIEE